MLNRLRDFDFYRKIPKDLTEATTHGSILSFLALLFMLLLFIAELNSFLTITYDTNVIIDRSIDTQLRINFNITVLDLPCEYAVIDVIDVLGTRTNNVTKNVNKWQIDSDGIRQNYVGRNREQQDVLHDTHHPDIDILHANGVHAVAIGESNFDEWIKSHSYTFVNFYAPWCIWCQRLEPVWEAFAEHIETEKLPVSIVKVDCVENRELCMNQKVQAFPMLKVFKDGEIQPPDYRSDRTVEALTAFIKSKITTDTHVARLDPAQQEAHKQQQELRRNDHPGCMLSGFLLVNRVPGNFHIEARSSLHNLNPLLANLSHVVNHLSFGPVLVNSAIKKLQTIPDDYFSYSSTHPVDSRLFLNDKLHQAFHHHLKVVPTTIELGGKHSVRNPSNIVTYQMVQSAQIMQYSEDDIPEARFSYDISAMSVNVVKKGKQWYEFLTSICALIGGTFTMVGLISGFLSAIFKSKKI